MTILFTDGRFICIARQHSLYLHYDGLPPEHTFLRDKSILRLPEYTYVVIELSMTRVKSNWMSKKNVVIQTDM